MCNEVIYIPLYEPEIEIVDPPLPEKVVFHDKYIEIHSKYKYMEKDEDTGEKTEVSVDTKRLILKRAISSLKTGISVQGCYITKILYDDYDTYIKFERKTEATDFYNKVLDWLINGTD